MANAGYAKLYYSWWTNSQAHADFSCGRYLAVDVLVHVNTSKVFLGAIVHQYDKASGAHIRYVSTPQQLRAAESTVNFDLDAAVWTKRTGGTESKNQKASQRDYLSSVEFYTAWFKSNYPNGTYGLTSFGNVRVLAAKATPREYICSSSAAGVVFDGQCGKGAFIRHIEQYEPFQLAAASQISCPVPMQNQYKVYLPERKNTVAYLGASKTYKCNAFGQPLGV